jgi:hypothetical protein
MLERDAGSPRINWCMVNLGTCLIAGIRLAPEAAGECMDGAHRLCGDLPQYRPSQAFLGRPDPERHPAAEDWSPVIFAHAYKANTALHRNISNAIHEIDSYMHHELVGLFRND